MSLMDRLLSWLFPAPPSVAAPTRRLRATCEVCGKSIAVIASTGRLWKHECVSLETGEPVDECPADALLHDTWDEHRGLR